jgi:sirohydrochlorin cobaltochelatase
VNALILFAHGARDPAWALPFIAIRDAVRASNPNQRCELAFLELMQPSLSDVIEQCTSDNATTLTIAPLFMAAGGHLKNDLPKLIDQIRERHPSLSVRVLPPIGDVPEITNAIASWLNKSSTNL